MAEAGSRGPLPRLSVWIDPADVPGLQEAV